MERNILKMFVLAAGIVVVMLIVGCEEQQQQPSTKMARVVAAENIQLKKDLQQRDSEIEKLKEQRSDELEKQKGLLAECQKEIEVLQEQLAGRFEDQINNIMRDMTEENKNLREENESLKAQIEALKAEPLGEGLEVEPNEPEKPAELAAKPL
jgi:superfamily II RNA helicase